MINFNYLNKIRIFATLIVVMLHVSAPVRDQLANMNVLNWFIGSLFDVFSRAGVPIFLMISGALLLNKDESIKEFYKKRLIRILIPFLFWGVFYAFYWGLTSGKEINMLDTALSVFKGATSYHLWYLYVIIGIYFVTPFLRVLVVNLSKKHLQVLLLLWLIFSIILPHLYAEIYIWFSINTRLGFGMSMIDVHLGYFILGYYIHKHFVPTQKASFYLLVFIFTTIITVCLSYIIYLHYNAYNPLFILNESPFVFLQASLIFLYFKKRAETKNETSNMIFSQINVLSFGLYLIHPFIIDLFDKGYLGFAMHAKSMDTIGSIPLTFLLVFFGSFGVCFLISKIPFVRKIIM